jgi:hypothetical protein
MPWKPKKESIGIFRSASSKQRAWWEVPVLVHITIPALPGYLYLLLWAVSALLVATGGAGTPVARFGHRVEGWARVQLLLGIISYPVAWVLVIVLSIAKFHCWATKVGVAYCCGRNRSLAYAVQNRMGRALVDLNTKVG